MERKQSRKRLRPWLEDNANKNTFQGLKWIDKEKKIFRISWKHQSNRCWDVSDSEIFKEWAIFSGKFKVGDIENPPEWKTRLRTALTKLSDVEEMKGMHDLSDTENPYKVYRFLDEEEVSNSKIRQHGSPVSDIGTASSPSSSFQTSPGSQEDFLDASSENEGAFAQNRDPHGLLGNTSNTNIPTVVYEGISQTMAAGSRINQSENINVFTSDSCGSCMNYTANISDIPLNFQEGIMEPNIIAEQHSELPSDLVSLDINNMDCFNSKITDNMSIGSSLPSVDAIIHPTVGIKIYFVENCVKEDSFDEKGARLFCGDQPLFSIDHNIYGPEGLRQISVPHIDNITEQLPINEKQKQLIRDIQTNMERGLLLGSTKTEIYAQRLCKARVFAWNQAGKSARLDRESNTPVCVFSLNEFKCQLQAYIVGGTQSQPSPSVWFSFGQEYKNLPGQRHVLLYAKITHLEAEKLLKEMLNEQNDPEVLISNSNSGDLLVSLLKEKLSLEPNEDYQCKSIFDGI